MLIDYNVSGVFILLLLVVVLVGAIVRLFKRIPFSLAKKVTFWIVLVYVLVLLLSAVTVPFMDDREILGEEQQFIEETEDEAEDEQSRLYMALGQGKWDEIEERFLVSEERFPYKHPRLKIDRTLIENEYFPVFIEKKEGRGQDIEAYIFGNQVTAYGYNFTEKVSLPAIRVNEDILFINYPEFQELNIWMGKKEFTMNQFSENKNKKTMFSSGWVIKPHVYLRIPKDIQIQLSDEIKEDVTFVN